MWDIQKTIKSEVRHSIKYLDPCRALTVGKAWEADRTQQLGETLWTQQN